MLTICKFNLKKHFNVRSLKQFFKNLEVDKNDEKLYGIESFRSRQILYTQLKDGSLKLIAKDGFSQNVADARKHKRKFSMLVPTPSQLKLLDKLLKFILRKINKTIPISGLEVTFHFVKIYASEKGTTNSPEGIHRDGYDILVPCIVVERKNIIGGSSRFYENKKIIFDKVMREGSGIIVEENNNPSLFHDVSNIFLKNKTKIGYRCIIGIDINYTL